MNMQTFRVWWPHSQLHSTVESLSADSDSALESPFGKFVKLCQKEAEVLKLDITIGWIVRHEEASIVWCANTKEETIRLLLQYDNDLCNILPEMTLSEKGELL